MRFRDHIRQYITIIVVQIIALLILGRLPGLQIQSFSEIIGITLVYLIAQVIYWWSFINFFSYLPAWLYPLVTFLLSGGILMLLGNLVPGILIADFRTSFWIIMILTSMNATLAGILSLDIDQQFNKVITQRLVTLHEKPAKTDVPGFLFLEIDGVSEKVFRRALESGNMPTLKRWYDEGTHKIVGWETDFTAQTGAIQSGILLGNNKDIPGYRWWDRSLGRSIRSGNFWDAAAIEKRLSNGHGLLAGGGASRGNMFSGDAAESLFTISTVLNRERDAGPGFYMYLVNPFVTARLIIHFISGIVREWWQAFRQKLRKDKFIVNSRNFFYAFIRAGEGQLLQELTTYIVSNDILRGIPAIYATYAGYDNVGHYAGMETSEAFETLAEIDRFFARLAHIVKQAPRPYHIVILSDHGQSNGGTFQKAHGITLNQLVKSSLNGHSPLIISPTTAETWDHINTFLSDSIQADTRTARVLRTMWHSKIRNSLIEMGTNGEIQESQDKHAPIQDESLIVFGSGCTGLIYFTDSKQRMTYEAIQYRYPDLILNLVNHPGIGFALVRSSGNGDMVLGKAGIYFLDHDTFEGENPLSNFSPNAAALLRQESNLTNCPDIIINTSYDPVTEEICGFENQVSHHGGLGGPQSFPFIFYPSALPVNGKPIVGAVEVNRLLSSWREAIQLEGNLKS